MPPKRKIRNLPAESSQMSFFDPVYQHDGLAFNDDENDLLAEGIPRPSMGRGNNNESNETLDNDTIVNSDHEQTDEMMSTAKLVGRIRQIHKSIQQAQTMLESMEKFRNIVPGCEEQREKLCSIIANLEEQQASYVNLLNLIMVNAEGHSALLDQNEINREEDDENDDDLSLRGNIESPVRPRIESKIGFVPQATAAALPTLSLSDHEQTNRNDYSNYDSLVGSLKSDTLNWHDHQATTDDDATDAESEKEMERNLTLQKEQIRALQGQQRALLALKRRSEQRLMEQQQLVNEKTPKTNENNLLSDIHHLRKRLQTLRSRYEQKHQLETQQLKSSAREPRISTENRLKNLEHVRERLDELEQIVTYYQTDFNYQQNDESPPRPTAERRTKSPIEQQQGTPSNAPRQWEKLSSELTTKRLELEQAKSALSQLQQMVKKIQPDGHSSSARSTPLSTNNDFELCTNQFLYNATPPQPSQIGTLPRKPPSPASSSANVKIAAQHHEIERLVESRQRLHTLKDQITTLRQSMGTPPAQQQTYEEKLNDSRNLRPSYQPPYQESVNNDVAESDSDHSNSESDDDHRVRTNQLHMKQSNLCTSEGSLPKSEATTNDLSLQMREICHCLSTFIDEQKSFNRHIEQRLSTATNSPVATAPDPLFNQLQQQVLAQGLIVNLNTAYREIAVLQSEINAYQSENNRLISSISFDQQYHQHNPRECSSESSKPSLYHFNATIRPQPRSSVDEQYKQATRPLTTHRLLENSTKAAFNSHSAGNQAAIHVEKTRAETTPIKQERIDTFSTGSSSSRQRLKQKADVYDFPNHYGHSAKDDSSQSFVIHRRPVPTGNQLHAYEQKVDQQSTLSSIDGCQQLQELAFGDDSSDDGPQTRELPLSSHSAFSNENLNSDDVQTIDLQVKSIMVQLIPFMRLRIDDIFNLSTLNHLRERILFLFKQQPDSAQLIRHFASQFAELIDTTIEKYSGSSVRDCAADLIRDVSDVAFDELIRYKIISNTNNLSQDDYVRPHDRSASYQTREALFDDDGIGNDDDDDESDSDENELESTVRLVRINAQGNENVSGSNGHGCILVTNQKTAN